MGSLRKVMSSDFKNLFIPVNSPSGLHRCQVGKSWVLFTHVLANDSTAGCPSKTTTLSARYVAIIYIPGQSPRRELSLTKSCSTMNAVRFDPMTNFLMTLLAKIRCSESRYADGSSIRSTSAGTPRTRHIATRCNSPPERLFS